MNNFTKNFFYLFLISSVIILLIFLKLHSEEYIFLRFEVRDNQERDFIKATKSELTSTIYEYRDLYFLKKILKLKKKWHIISYRDNGSDYILQRDEKTIQQHNIVTLLKKKYELRDNQLYKEYKFEFKNADYLIIGDHKIIIKDVNFSYLPENIVDEVFTKEYLNRDDIKTPIVEELSWLDERYEYDEK